MDQRGHFEGVFCPLGSTNLSTSFQSLDTVRALHQTVVSLRTALDDAKKEIAKLKKQIIVQTEIDEGKEFRDKNQAISLPEITAEREETVASDENELRRTVKFSDDLKPSNLSGVKSVENVTHTSTITSGKSQSEKYSFKDDGKKSKREKVTEFSVESGRTKHEPSPRICIIPDINITSTPPVGDSGTHRQHKYKGMASKIDVKIKVSSNIKVDSTSSSEQDSIQSAKDSPREESDNDEADNTDQQQQQEHTGDKDESDGGKTEMIKTDGKNLTIRVTSEENLTLVKTGDEISITQNSNENLHLDIDDNSLSEGDNSVFTEGAITPIDSSGATALKIPADKQQKDSSSDHHEEVDDIELIFSSDDNKDLTQEDLVSISDYEPWQTPGSSGTPVLVNFSSLPKDSSLVSERERSVTVNDENKKSANEDGDASKEFRQSSQQRSLESSDSLNSENVKNSFDSTKNSTSFEKETSLDQHDGMKRDESFDTFDNMDTTSFGRKWTNTNVLIETDISKCGIIEENILEMGRRNTCPNPPSYRPLIHREAIAQSRQLSSRCPFGVKFSRTAARSQYHAAHSRSPRPVLSETNRMGPKRSSSAQTDISALPEHWQSESHLASGRYGVCGLYTLPSKFTPTTGMGSRRYPLRPSDKTQEARRVLLSDINFTSMVPELSRSADHLCHEDDQQSGDRNGSDENRHDRGGGGGGGGGAGLGGGSTGGGCGRTGTVGGSTEENRSPGYCKGNLLRTPDYSTRGITPSVSLNSPGISQWTVNETSFGTQTAQTGSYWGHRGDSFDSTRSFSASSRYSSGLSKHHRSRSVPSVRCAICKMNHGYSGLRTSESMHYTPRVTFQEPSHGIRGSLPDLRHECICPRRYQTHSFMRIHGDSSGSTESLIDEAEDFLRRSVDGITLHDTINNRSSIEIGSSSGTKRVNRRSSENDIQREYIPSKQSLPFLPRSPKCLKPGHLAKVISKNGRVVVGRVRYIGPLASFDKSLNGGIVGDDDNYVGLQLPNNFGDCDGSIDGRKFFDCEPLHGLFVPFKKVIMAWTA